jgi:hypothetical protein
VYNINFVHIIEKYRCIWDLKDTLKDYSKRNVTEKAWKDVANTVYDSGKNNFFFVQKRFYSTKNCVLVE